MPSRPRHPIKEFESFLREIERNDETWIFTYQETDARFGIIRCPARGGCGRRGIPTRPREPLELLAKLRRDIKDCPHSP